LDAHSAIRVILGVVFVVPVPLAFLAVTSEFRGGAGLIVGLLSRVTAVGVCVTMLSAIVMCTGVTVFS
jgi:uncharacterized membrane protein YphA (DoxX/SURF4 family)